MQLNFFLFKYMSHGIVMQYRNKYGQDICIRNDDSIKRLRQDKIP